MHQTKKNFVSRLKSDSDFKNKFRLKPFLGPKIKIIIGTRQDQIKVGISSKSDFYPCTCLLE